jgi:recombination protein RecA
MYGEGISKEGEILDIGVEFDIVGKSGAWYSYNNEKIGQGRENAKQFLRDNPLISQEIGQKIRENLQIINTKSEAVVDEE